MKPIQPTQKPFEVGDLVKTDAGYGGVIIANTPENRFTIERNDGVVTTVEFEERQLAHVRRPMRHDFSDDEIAALWVKYKLPRVSQDKMILFSRSLLHGRPAE